MCFDRLVQAILAPGAVAVLSAQARGILAATEGPVLDVGGGYNSPLLRAGIRPVGVDIDPARARVHGHSAAAVAADAALLPFVDGAFAAAVSIGLLHHLTDQAARRAILEMMRVVRPGGPVAVFDGVLPAARWRRPLASLIRALDHGRHMRGEPQLRALFDGIPGWHYQRMTYAMTGLEGVWCIRPTTGKRNADRR